MKSEELIVLGLAGLALWLIMKGKGSLPAFSSAVASAGSNSARKINVDNDAGWQYFTDGTAIDPSGAYYANGVKVWAP